MYYIAYIGMAIVIIHFILYYFNIDVFNYPIKPETPIIYNDITDSINELKKLNEYIDNGICDNETRASETGASETRISETGISETRISEKGTYESVSETRTGCDGPDENAICKIL